MKRTGNILKRQDLVPLNDVNGPRLGEHSDYEYKDIAVPFTEGDMVFLYTDGILDIENPEGKKWGEREFLKTLLASANSGKDIEGKIESLKDVVTNFRSGSSLIDDVTLVMVEYEMAAKVAA
jgi:sigma-B regulation protein RsbU (phosphoserine phosphatase)